MSVVLIPLLTKGHKACGKNTAIVDGLCHGDNTSRKEQEVQKLSSDGEHVVLLAIPLTAPLGLHLPSLAVLIKRLLTSQTM